MKLQKSNPRPFKQPFLCFQMRRGAGRKIEIWHIDIGGQIGKYITKQNKPTALLIEKCKEMASYGYEVILFGSYIGSAGPSHVMLNGTFFCRMHDEFEAHDGNEAKSIAYDPPQYSECW